MIKDGIRVGMVFILSVWLYINTVEGRGCKWFGSYTNI